MSVEALLEICETFQRKLAPQELAFTYHVRSWLAQHSGSTTFHEDVLTQIVNRVAPGLLEEEE